MFIFDADSQWLTLILNMVAGMLRKGTEVLYISLYTSVMTSADGVFELTTEEIEGEMQNTLRARAFKGAPVDTSKYILHIAEDLSVSLETIKKRN